MENSLFIQDKNSWFTTISRTFLFQCNRQRLVKFIESVMTDLDEEKVDSIKNLKSHLEHCLIGIDNLMFTYVGDINIISKLKIFKEAIQKAIDSK